MSDGIPIFDAQVQEANAWLKEIAAEVGGDRQAYKALRATLHVLRDRVTIGEASALGAQLPMVIKGVYYDQWKPHGTPRTYRTRDEFLDEIRKDMAARPGVDADAAGDAAVDPDAAARAVLHALRDHLDTREVEALIAILPEPVRALWH